MDTFSPRQLAKRHGASYNTLRFAIERGDLQVTITPRGYRISDAAYIEWRDNPLMHDHTTRREVRGLPPSKRESHANP